MYCKTVLVIAIYCINGTLQQDIPEIVGKIDSFVTNLMECFDVPGLTLAVVKEDQVIFYINIWPQSMPKSY